MIESIIYPSIITQPRKSSWNHQRRKPVRDQKLFRPSILRKVRKLSERTHKKLPSGAFDRCVVNATCWKATLNKLRKLLRILHAWDLGIASTYP